MSDSIKRVLIIDDDEQLRALLHEILERAGFAVIEAVNGVEGLKLFRSAPADLVITDLIMPDKEGVETILELRREFPEARVIAISGGGRNSSTNYLPIAARLGARRTLAKPFSRQEILEAVRETLAT
jgi:DNA-binding response OmpR family regulator